MQLDKIMAEHERQQKGFEDEVERIRVEAQNRISDAERKYANALEVSSKNSSYTVISKISIYSV